MVLYNIHSHLHSISQINNYAIRYIINTYPLEFDLLRRQQPSAKVFSCGIHPWFTDNADGQFSRLKELVNEQDNIVAIGEIGLDKLKGADMNTQTKIFRRQAEFAEEMSKPLIIHCVKAWAELIAVKQELKPRQRWIIHGFRGGKDLAQQLLCHGFQFSFGQNINSEAIKSIPQSSIFLETDDSPSSIYTIYSQAAKVLGLNIGELVNVVKNNVSSTFKLAAKTVV